MEKLTEIRDTFQIFQKKDTFLQTFIAYFCRVGTIKINLKFYVKILRRHPTQLTLRNLNLCSEFLTELYNSKKGRSKNFGVLGWTSLYV